MVSRNYYITRIAFKMGCVASVLFVMGDFIFCDSGNPKFKLSVIFSFNERTVLFVQNKCTENV